MENKLILLSANVIIASANVFFIYFYFMQLRESKKAVLHVKLVHYNKIRYGAQKVLERSPEHLVIDNRSNNRANQIKVNGIIHFKNRAIRVINQCLKYLNPYEGVVILVDFKQVIDSFPGLFQQIESEENGAKTICTIPKETIYLTLDVSIKWRPFYSQRDSYYIEWGSLKSYPNIKNHPMINSWNKRDNQYILKLDRLK